MAKAEGFKNKITKAQEDLFKALETEKEKKNGLFTKLVAELAKQNKANVKSLNSLNKEYVELCKQNTNSLNEFISKVNELNSNLEQTIENYKEVPNEENEYKLIQEQNEEKKKSITNKYKREIQDVNIKIDRIEKELKELLEEKEESYNDDVNSFKSKLIELDKRKKFEVSKIQGNTIKEYDDLQVKLLNENKRSEIKVINKSIKQIRLNGFLEEKECLFRHLAEQKQAELDYIKLQYEYKCETNALDKEYLNRIEDAKYDKAMIQHNYKKNIDGSNDHFDHLFNENMKNAKLQKNKDFENCYNELNQAHINQYKYESEKVNVETSNAQNVYTQLELLDKKQTSKFLEFNEKGIAILSKELSLFQKNLVLTINFYAQNINDIYQMYFKNLQAKEAEYINALIVGCVEGAFLNGNDNNEFVSKIENLFNGFISEEENIIKSFNDFIETAVNNLLNNIQLFFDEISKLNTQITSTFTKYHNDFDLLFEEAKNKGITHSNNLKAETELQIKNNELANESLYKSRCEEVKEKIVIIEKEFVDREEVIKLTEEKQKEEYLSDYEQILKDRENAKLKIEESYVAIANTYLREYEDKVKALNEKFVILQENVDKEYKTKMGLL